jgi:hypothetical protein
VFEKKNTSHNQQVYFFKQPIFISYINSCVFASCSIVYQNYYINDMTKLKKPVIKKLQISVKMFANFCGLFGDGIFILLSILQTAKGLGEFFSCRRLY